MSNSINNITDNKLDGIGYSSIAKHSNLIKQEESEDKDLSLSALKPISEALDELKNLPEIRMEKVEYAQKLISDTNYPYDSDLQKISEFLLDIDN